MVTVEKLKVGRSHKLRIRGLIFGVPKISRFPINLASCMRYENFARGYDRVREGIGKRAFVSAADENPRVRCGEGGHADSCRIGS